MSKLKWLGRFKHIRLTKTANYFFLGAVLVLVGTFAAWQFTKIFAPSSNLNPGGNPELRLKTSDHDLSDNLLPNSMADTTTPNYNNAEQVHLIPVIGGAVKLPRIQGEVWFR